MSVTYVPITTNNVGVPATAGDLTLTPDQYQQLYTSDINDLINQQAQSAIDNLPQQELGSLGSSPLAVYAMPYDPNYNAEVANASPAYSPTSGATNFKGKIGLWIALGFIALGLLIFRKKIGKVVDRLV